MFRDFGMTSKFRTSARIVSTAAQVANSRLFVLRNNGTNILVVQSLVLKALQAAAGTAQENALDVYKLTGFTVLDTTNTITPVASIMKTNANAANNAQIRALGANVNGMTGGTSVKDSTPIAELPYNVAAAINLTSMPQLECFPDIAGGGEPLILAQNEGLLVESRILNVTSFGITWYIDATWAEAAPY